MGVAGLRLPVAGLFPAVSVCEENFFRLRLFSSFVERAKAPRISRGAPKTLTIYSLR
jgi:hypothetical protein